MAESPTIETERLRIIPFSEQHLTARYVGWLNDPDVVRYSDQRFRKHTVASCSEYWQSFAGAPNYFWAIVAREPELGHIGTMNAYVDTIHSVADLGILIGERRVWGRGYGSEAWVGVCDYLLDEGGIRKVTAGTLSVNTAMLGVMRRAGMVEDGRRRRHSLFEGREVDAIHVALFRKDREHADESTLSSVRGGIENG